MKYLRKIASFISTQLGNSINILSVYSQGIRQEMLEIHCNNLYCGNTTQLIDLKWLHSIIAQFELTFKNLVTILLYVRGL